MPGIAEVRAAVAPLLQVTPSELSPQTSLQRFSSSLERTKLELALRRIGVMLAPGVVGPRLGDLEARLGLDGAGRAAEAVAPVAAVDPVQARTDSSALSIGVDIEMISALPEAADPWENDFYTTTFTASEIAACLLRETPRVHFAGTWCAKEALRKSNPAFAGLASQSIRLDHTATGSPFLQVLQRGEWQRLPCAVSISHTDSIAAAVVGWSPARAEAPAPPMSPPTVSSAKRRVSPAVLAALTLSLAALATSAFALLTR